MTYKKRSSRTLNHVQKRLTGFKSIGPESDLGNGVSVQVFTDKVNHLQTLLDQYNITLAHADTLKGKIVEAEKEIARYAEKVLLAVAVTYGKDSLEYVRLGGVRPQDRKRPSRPKPMPIG